MLSHQIGRALPSRPARVVVAGIAYLLFAVTVIASTQHRDEEDTLRDQAAFAQSEGRSSAYELDFEAAERHYRYAIELIRACGGEKDDDTVAWFAEAHEDLGDALEAQGKLPAAEAVYNRALRLYVRAYGEDSRSLTGPLLSLGDIYEETGRDSADEACAARIREILKASAKSAESQLAHFRAAQRRTVAERRATNPLATAERLVDLGRLHLQAGAPDRAESEFAEAHDLYLAALGPRDYRTVTAREHLGKARAVSGKVAQARVDLESALANNRRAVGLNSDYVRSELLTLGNIAMKCADYAGADTCYTRVVESLQEKIGAEHWFLVPALEKLARCRTEMGQFNVARGLRERIRRIHERALGERSYAVGVDYLKLAEIEDRAGRSGPARSNCSKAATILDATVGPRHPMAVEARIYLGELWDEADSPIDPDAIGPKGKGSRSLVDGVQPEPRPRRAPAADEDEEDDDPPVA